MYVCVCVSLHQARRLWGSLGLEELLVLLLLTEKINILQDCNNI